MLRRIKWVSCGQCSRSARNAFKLASVNKTDGYKEKLRCVYPEERLEVHNEGRVFFCCPTWLPTPIGNVRDQTLLQLRESSQGKAIRASVRDGSFAYCKKKLCPYLSELETKDKLQPPIVSANSGERPQQIAVMLNYDFSCNLRCPSCRSTQILYRRDQLPPLVSEVHQAVEKSLAELLSAGFDLKLNITGSGDAFASPLYYDLLQKCEYSPHLRLELQTNGILMQEKRFTSAMKAMTEFIAVSVDASSSATYEKIRQGGNFSTLQENIVRMNQWIKQGAFPVLRDFKLNFIVQKDNYEEIVDFARWAQSLDSVTEIWFNLIADWGHLPAATFAEKAIWRDDHPEHKQFLKVLESPVLRADARMNWGNMGHFMG